MKVERGGGGGVGVLDAPGEMGGLKGAVVMLRVYQKVTLAGGDGCGYPECSIPEERFVFVLL